MRVEDIQGRRSLYLKGAIAYLTDSNFRTGVIEFDLALTDYSRNFPGLNFRGRDELNSEYFYIRPHKSGNPDAMQYGVVPLIESAYQETKGEPLGPAPPPGIALERKAANRRRQRVREDSVPGVPFP